MARPADATTTVSAPATRAPRPAARVAARCSTAGASAVRAEAAASAHAHPRRAPRRPIGRSGGPAGVSKASNRSRDARRGTQTTLRQRPRPRLAPSARRGHAGRTGARRAESRGRRCGTLAESVCDKRPARRTGLARALTSAVQGYDAGRCGAESGLELGLARVSFGAGAASTRLRVVGLRRQRRAQVTEREARHAKSV